MVDLFRSRLGRVNKCKLYIDTDSIELRFLPTFVQCFNRVYIRQII